jgi:serine/threonine-protein phosphatase 5
LKVIDFYYLDASKAIKIDSEYIKAYYRRASANLVLNHLDDAISDLEFLIKKLPQEDVLKEKLAKAKSQKKKKLLLESLKSDRPEYSFLL